MKKRVVACWGRETKEFVREKYKGDTGMEPTLLLELRRVVVLGNWAYGPSNLQYNPDYWAQAHCWVSFFFSNERRIETFQSYALPAIFDGMYKIDTNLIKH